MFHFLLTPESLLVVTTNISIYLFVCFFLLLQILNKKINTKVLAQNKEKQQKLMNEIRRKQKKIEFQ